MCEYRAWMRGEPAMETGGLNEKRGGKEMNEFAYSEQGLAMTKNFEGLSLKAY
jgi:hypothetical protein